MEIVRVIALDVAYDDADPPGYRSGLAKLGPRLGALRTGASVYELPAGEAACPYHYEYGEEEWLLVLAGRPSVRTPQGTTELEPMDLVFFARGPDGAHQVRNDSDAPARILMWSDVVVPSATAYPDSAKVGVWTGDPDENLIVERSAAVPYFHGEAP